MDRRKFLRIGSMATVGSGLLYPLNGMLKSFDTPKYSGKTPKNIIMLVSDGMSTGTMSMTDIFSQRKFGKETNWMNLYRENKATRALMDMASADSIVTDSSAASSSWGGGHRVNNGSLNVGPNGEEYLPIWQKFKNAGKMAGCVTSVAITHATPAGFCAISSKRSAQDDIAEQYLKVGFDVLLGGGQNNFDPAVRKDKKDMYSQYKSKGYQIAKTKDELKRLNSNAPILGVFASDALPYSLDRMTEKKLDNKIPSLAEMSEKAIEYLSKSEKGFVLQIESGKVDWAAHGNDLTALLYDQLAFDDAIKVAIDFAEKDKNTLVIITTDHGNANPGLIYGDKANRNFDSVHHYKKTNEWILNKFSEKSNVEYIIDTIKYATNLVISRDEAAQIKKYYSGLEKPEGGLYNSRKLPFKLFANIQEPKTSVGWISMEHSGDYVELAMYGPGSENLKPLMKNTDLHYFMLDVTEVQAS